MPMVIAEGTVLSVSGDNLQIVVEDGRSADGRTFSQTVNALGRGLAFGDRVIIKGEYIATQKGLKFWRNAVAKVAPVGGIEAAWSAIE